MRVQMGWVVVAVGAFLSAAALLWWTADDVGAAPVVATLVAACTTAVGAAMLWRRRPVGRWFAVALTCGAFAATWLSYRMYEFRSMPPAGRFIAPDN